VFLLILLEFTDILGFGLHVVDHLICIFFHVIILPDYRFFFEVPSFEELQDSNSSPRREEVGRHTLGDYGGFLLPFFYRARFRESRALLENVKLGKFILIRTPITSGVEESNSPRRVLLLLLANSSEGDSRKKNTYVNK
jgi:hypothetical protein